jgi:hypothetical protein
MNARWALFCVLLAGCGGDSPILPKFSDIQTRVFSRSCVFSSCHSDDGHKGELVLAPGEAYDNLVGDGGVLANNDLAAARGLKRVVPGHPEQSYLWMKLDQGEIPTPDGGLGDPMPQVGTRLPQQTIDAIRDWILQGAQNN